jgi:hypothetical protein
MSAYQEALDVRGAAIKRAIKFLRECEEIGGDGDEGNVVDFEAPLPADWYISMPNLWRAALSTLRVTVRDMEGTLRLNIDSRKTSKRIRSILNDLKAALANMEALPPPPPEPPNGGNRKAA